MKSYVIQIEDSNNTDKEILMQIIKALAKASIKTTGAGVQQIQPINLKEKLNNE